MLRLSTMETSIENIRASTPAVNGWSTGDWHKKKKETKITYLSASTTDSRVHRSPQGSLTRPRDAVVQIKIGTEACSRWRLRLYFGDSKYLLDERIEQCEGNVGSRHEARRETIPRACLEDVGAVDYGVRET